MNNLANQLPSYDSDTIVQANNTYSCLPMGRTPAEIQHDQVVIKQDNGGEEGSKKFTLSYTSATALKPGFCAAKGFVQRNMNGEDNDADSTSYTYIQEFFCSTLTNVDSLEQGVVLYDLKDILILGSFLILQMLKLK